MQFARVKDRYLQKAAFAVLLCAPEVLSLMPQWIGFNMYSSLPAFAGMALCIIVSIGLAVSAVRKGNDAAWALGFLALAIHVGFLGELLSPHQGSL